MKISRIVFYFTVSLLFIPKNLASASIDGTTSVKYLTTNQVFHNNQYARGYVTLNSGATILSDATAFFNINTPLKGGLDLRETGTLSLEGDLYLDSNVTLSRSGVIKGNGKTIFLNGNLTIPDNSVIHINSNSIIDGQGHDLVFGRRGRIFVDTNITLTLRNMKIVQNYNDFSDPCVRLASFKSQLALNDVEFALSQDFLFTQGELFIHGDVTVTGTSAFIYQSTQHSFIASDSIFYFDKATTFSVIPATFTDCRFDQWPTYTSNCFIVMADQTSRLLFNEASLCSTSTGCRFAKSTVNFANNCNIKSNSALDLPQAYIADTGVNIQTGRLPAYVAYSPNGNYLAIVNKQSNTLQIFDSVSHAQIGSDVISGNLPVAVSWSNTSTQLAVVNSGDNTVKVFNFNGLSIPTLSVSNFTGANPSCVAWSLYGNYIAVTNAGSNTVQIFKASTLSQVGSSAVTGSIPSSVTWATGDRFLAVTNMGSNTLQIFSFNGSSTPVLAASNATGVTPSSVSWAQNGLFLSVANKDSNTLQIFSFDKNHALALIDTVSSNYEPIATTWTPDGSYIGVSDHYSQKVQFLRFYNQSLLSQVGGNATTGSHPYQVSWSSDGLFLAVVNDDSNTLQIFSFNGSSTPLLVASSATGMFPWTVSWSPSLPSPNYFLTVANMGSSLQVFSFDGVSTITSLATQAVIDISAASWSPVGNFIAAVKRDTTNTLAVFHFDGISTLTQVGIDVGAGDNPWAVSWSPAGNFIAVVSLYDSLLHIFSFNGSSSPVPIASTATASSRSPAAWSPDGNFIAVAGRIAPLTGVLQIFNFNGSAFGSSYTTITRKHMISETAVSWTSDGRFIAVGTELSEPDSSTNIPGILQIFSFNGYSAATEVCSSVVAGKTPRFVSWDSTGKFVAVINEESNTLQVFSMDVYFDLSQASKNVFTQSNPFSISCSSSDGYVAVTNGNSDNVQLFQLQYPAILTQVGSDLPFGEGVYENPYSVSWSSDDRFLSVVSWNYLKAYSFNGLSTPTQVGSALNWSGKNVSVSWSPSGPYIGSVRAVNESIDIFLFDEITGPTTYAFGCSTDNYPNSLSWAPSGNFVAVANRDSDTLQVFSFDGLNTVIFGRTRPILVSSITTGSEPTSVSWSSDGRFIAVVNGGANTLQVFSFNGVNTTTLIGGSVSTGSTPTSVSWSPDGRFIAVLNNGTNTLQVFSFNGASTPVQIGVSARTDNSPNSLSWSVDGNFITVVNGDSNTLQVFLFNGASTPVLVDEIGAGRGPISVSWSHSGNFIAVANYTAQTLQVFRVNYVPNISEQAISNGVVFGNSIFGSDYDATVRLFAGSNVLVDGLVNYDCVI